VTARPPRSPRPRKSLGQHFLFDAAILDRIVATLDLVPGDVVLEIGPGPGTLTERLLRHGARVVAIEKDQRLVRECGMRNAEWGMDRLTVIHGDALRVDWHGLIPHPAFPMPHWKVAGNIPYAITTPLIERALTPPLPERIVFLVQAEVAARLAAAPGTRAYGALTVGVQALCRVERLFGVKAGAFRPPPRVDSAVLRLTPLATPLVAPAEHAALRRFVTACFGRRRKQLRNAVAVAWGRPAAETAARLAAAGVDPAARPERLAPDQFVALLRLGR
jgi:16S rRNA (adenine1518-N6/adenine1519-N6)-dimethyltransferase